MRQLGQHSEATSQRSCTAIRCGSQKNLPENHALENESSIQLSDAPATLPRSTKHRYASIFSFVSYLPQFPLTKSPQAELDALERRWRRRLEMQQRESAKKAAASAAAAASVVISGENHVYPPIQPNNKTLAPRSITKTASWLDRANTVLAAPQEQARAAPKTTIENQMKEVQRLIHEGKQTTSFIHDQQVNSPPQLQDPSKPLDKRPRRHSGAEDAEALVGFFNSVRAAAATASRSALD